jgi:hypothetical protein
VMSMPMRMMYLNWPSNDLEALNWWETQISNTQWKRCNTSEIGCTVPQTCWLRRWTSLINTLFSIAAEEEDANLRINAVSKSNPHSLSWWWTWMD